MRRRGALSLLTLVWLAALLTVGALRERGTWPVSRSTMFSEGATRHVRPELYGRTTDGRLVPVSPAGFGLRAAQLNNWLARRTGSRVDAGDRRVLALLAALWHERHPNDQLAAVRLWIHEVDLPLRPGRESNRLALHWRSP